MRFYRIKIIHCNIEYPKIVLWMMYAFGCCACLNMYGYLLDVKQLTGLFEIDM